MDVTILCPDHKTPLVFTIDTQGDPSVGISPEGVEEVDGICSCVEPLNDLVQEFGEDGLAACPGIVDQLYAVLEAQARAEAEDEAEPMIIEDINEPHREPQVKP